MFGIGMPEMLLLLAVALIVVGPKKLPDLAKSIGRSLGEFKKATRDIKESFDPDNELSDVKKAFDDMNESIQKPLDAIISDGASDTEEETFSRPNDPDDKPDDPKDPPPLSIDPDSEGPKDA